MTRREGALAALGIFLGVGVAGGAWASRGADRPSSSEIEAYCSLQAEGASKLAEDLRRRERELDARESSLAAQAGEMSAAETRLTERLAALEKTRTEITALVETVDAAREEKLMALVKMVEANKASAVAPMFAALEPELAVEVLDRMNRTKAGKLLTALSATKAAALASRMTQPIVVEVP